MCRVTGGTVCPGPLLSGQGNIWYSLSPFKLLDSKRQALTTARIVVNISARLEAVELCCHVWLFTLCCGVSPNELTTGSAAVDRTSSTLLRNALEGKQR